MYVVGSLSCCLSAQHLECTASISSASLSCFQNFVLNPLPFPPEQLALEYTGYWHPPKAKKQKQKWRKQVLVRVLGKAACLVAACLIRSDRPRANRFATPKPNGTRARYVHSIYRIANPSLVWSCPHSVAAAASDRRLRFG